MRYITVDQFEGTNFVDVYVMDDKLNDTLEIEQGVTLAYSYELIKKFKEEYSIYKADFIEYDEYERELARREVIL